MKVGLYFLKVCGNVTVRADLQTASQRINLVPGTNPDTALHSRSCNNKHFIVMSFLVDLSMG